MEYEYNGILLLMTAVIHILLDTHRVGARVANERARRLSRGVTEEGKQIDSVHTSLDVLPHNLHPWASFDEEQ